MFVRCVLIVVFNNEKIDFIILIKNLQMMVWNVYVRSLCFDPFF